MAYSFDSELVNCIPNLQRYACKLTRDASSAEDLTQDCLARALSRSHRFEPGTNMQAWLTTMIKNLIALPYELARLPLAVADQQLADRLPETSVPRLTMDRTLGSAATVAGAVLRNRDIADRGAERLERSGKLTKAARLEQEAELRREQARSAAESGQEEAAAKRQAAQERAEKGLDEAATAEARGKQQAKATARKSAAAKKSAADQKAQSREAAAEQRQERAEATAEAKKKAAQQEAKAELDEARQDKQEADEARADAERLSELTEAKKQERTD